MFAVAVSFSTIAPSLYLHNTGWNAWEDFFKCVSHGHKVAAMARIAGRDCWARYDGKEKGFTFQSY